MNGPSEEAWGRCGRERRGSREAGETARVRKTATNKFTRGKGEGCEETKGEEGVVEREREMEIRGQKPRRVPRV